MRVLMINVVCGIRSTGRICTDYAKELEAQGHEVKIAYGRKCTPVHFQKYAVRIGTRFSVGIHILMSRLFDAHGLWSRNATKEFLKWADDFNPDILLLHNIHGYYINYEMLFAWIKERPQMKVKWTLHDCWAFTGHCSYFSYVGCNQWREHCKKCCRKQRRSYPSSLFVCRSFKNFEKKKEAFTGIKNLFLITPSQWLADLVRQSFLGDYPIEVRHNTIDTNVFKPTPGDFRKRYNLENQKIVLGVANIWDERKGLQDFYDLRKMLDETFMIVLVGLTYMQRTALPVGIIGIEKTNNPAELAEIYTAANVFINPTYEDNYPAVNLEAEACGTPVITYASGGSPETLKSPSSATVPTGEVKAIVQKILMIKV